MKGKVRLSLIIMWVITLIIWISILFFQLAFGNVYINLSAWNTSLWVVILAGLGIIGYYSGDWKNLRMFMIISALYQVPFTLLYLVFGVVPLEIFMDYAGKIFFGTAAGICGSNIHKLNIMEKRVHAKHKKRYSVRIYL